MALKFPVGNNDDPKTLHDIVSTGKDQVASVLSDQEGTTMEQWKFVFS